MIQIIIITDTFFQILNLEPSDHHSKGHMLILHFIMITFLCNPVCSILYVKKLF